MDCFVASAPRNDAWFARLLIAGMAHIMALQWFEMTALPWCGAQMKRVLMARISLIVNGNPVNANVDPRTLLVQFLRENLRLTGTHVGCDTSQCGACVVHLDGKAVKACTTLAVMADGHEVKTIEGLAADGAPLHPMQEAFREHHGLQCGFCTPGMIMTAVDLVHRKGHDLSDHTIREELEGNLCRCTGYQNIVLSISAGAKAMANSDLA
jgi:aerobic carbon-monoxide dehydrogenase small subunit